MRVFIYTNLMVTFLVVNVAVHLSAMSLRGLVLICASQTSTVVNIEIFNV